MSRKNEAKWYEKYKYWKIQVQKEGQRKPFYSSTKGKKGKIEAERKADAWLDNSTDRKNARMGDAWEEYLEDVKLLKSRSEYIQTEQLGRLWILPDLKHKYVRSISSQDWQRIINTAYKAGKYKKTLMNIRGKITNFCKFARKAQYTEQPPIDLVIPKDAPVKEKSILQPDALITLFTSDWEIWRGRKRKAFYINAFRLDAVLGLRKGELCGLKWEDVEDDMLFIRRAINYLNEETDGKNKNAKRNMVLADMAKQLLAEQSALLKEHGLISPYIFPHEKGQRVNPAHVYDAWCRYKTTHSLGDVDMQGLRRTMVSVIKNDMPLDMAKRIVGHSKDMDTYGIYGRQIDGELEQAANIIDQAFGKLLGKNEGVKK